jgi:hypothetical protein
MLPKWLLSLSSTVWGNQWVSSLCPNHKEHFTCESENALYLDIPSFSIDTWNKIILYYFIIWFDAPWSDIQIENSLYLAIPSFPTDTLNKIVLYYFIIWFDVHWIDIQSVWWWCVLIAGSCWNLSTHVQLQDGSVVSLDEKSRKAILASLHELSTKALRCLGFAYKEDLGEFATYDGEFHPAHEVPQSYLSSYFLSSSWLLCCSWFFLNLFVISVHDLPLLLLLASFYYFCSWFATIIDLFLIANVIFD